MPSRDHTTHPSKTTFKSVEIFALFRSCLECALPHGCKERDVDIYLRLNGLDGQAAESLRQTATRYQLSGERVRQISENIGAFRYDLMIGSASYRTLVKKVDAIVEIIVENLPMADEEMSELLISEKLVPPDTFASSTVRVADVLARNATISVDRWLDVDALVSKTMPNCFGSLLTHAKKIVSASGACSIEILCESFSKVKLVELSHHEARAMISPFVKMVGNVGENSSGKKVPIGEWFYFPGIASDMLARATKRIVSFGFCSLSQLSLMDSSMTRSQYGYRIPSVMLAEVLSANGFVIDADRVTLPEGAISDGKKGLSKTKAKMVAILRNAGGKAKQGDYVRACTEAGINGTTAKLYLHRSGLFRCVKGVCTLAP